MPPEARRSHATADPEPVEPARVPGRLADDLIREIGSWIDRDRHEHVVALTAAWDPPTLSAARRMIAAHGLAPLLARDPAFATLTPALPEELRAWIALQEERNRTRIDRLHGELAGALRALSAMGVAAMPLKGSILTTRVGGDRHRRPMADLDILVHSDDLDAARGALVGLGYRRQMAANRRPTHDTFLRPGNDEVVSFDGEHPDNPRPIELHVEVKRHLWAWVDDDDLTAFLWSGAREGTVLGEPALLPSDRALLAHLAIHATSDLLGSRGRLVQWLDVAEAAADADGDASDAWAAMPHPRLLYPALRLVARRFAGRFGDRLPDLASLQALMPESLVRWAATVPLDTRAGLQSGRFRPADMSTWRARWERWAPATWRLAVAYGSLPRPLAFTRHVARVARAARQRLR